MKIFSLLEKEELYNYAYIRDTYLLFQWGLYGDMLINAYYTIMSLYGWWAWLQIEEFVEKENVNQNYVLSQMLICLISGL